MQQVEQLTLVFMDAFDVHIEDGRGVEADPQHVPDSLGQQFLVALAAERIFVAEILALGEGFQRLQMILGAMQNLLTESVDQQMRQPRIDLKQPAAEGHAIGLVVHPVGIEPVQIAKHRIAHQPRMQRGNAVDAVRAEKRQVAHAHAAAVVFLDQRHRAQQAKVVDVLGTQRIDMLGVDQVDDLQVPRQQTLHQRYRPGLQRFGQQRVVGVGGGGDRQLPGLRPGQAMLVHQQAHQLDHSDGRMSVVELDRHLLRQALQTVMQTQMTLEQIL